MTVNRIDTSAHQRSAGLSPSASRLLKEAGRAFVRMDLGAAERALISVLAMKPHSAEANRLMGIVSQMRGEFPQALEFLLKAQISCPDDAMIVTNLGSALYEVGKIEEALAALRSACELSPAMASAWYNLGKALKQQAATTQACTALQKALDIDPAHITARQSLADAQVSLGSIAEAIGNYREILRRQPDNHEAWYALANLKTIRFNEYETAQLQRLFKQTTQKAVPRISVGFALAKAFEDQENYDAAFETLRVTNALKRSQVEWDATAHRTQVDAIIRSFEEPVFAPIDPDLGQEVIFIIGMPRSGSTLIEQILASHSQVEGANEITDLPQVIADESKRRGQSFPQWVAAATPEDWCRLGKDYLSRTKRWRESRPRFADKNLVTWELLGPIVHMLPGARFVNSRRDPVETCFACYRQLFSNGAHFSYSLEEVAEYHLNYDLLIRHWQSLFPGRIFTNDYEVLLSEAETQIRRLLAFCNLEFEPACLSFHRTSRTVLSTASAAQVRQPLRANTSRSALYGSNLDVLRSRLLAPGPTNTYKNS